MGKHDDRNTETALGAAKMPHMTARSEQVARPRVRAVQTEPARWPAANPGANPGAKPSDQPGGKKARFEYILPLEYQPTPEVVAALVHFLTMAHESRRPPEVAARVLGMVVELWMHGQPFPSRADVAHDLGCSKWGIDAALNTAMARELVSIEIDTDGDSRIKHRAAVSQVRYIIPDTSLVELVNRIKRETAPRSRAGRR